MLDALGRFGARTGSLSARDLTDPTTIFQIGIHGNRIDIMTAVPGLTFEAAWGRRGTFLMSDAGSPVLSVEDTLAAARASNRPKDRARVRALEKAMAMRKGLPAKKR